ncbi:MAG TPA: sugar transferase [bacterium]|nr:sugar transferase [bacterium]
MKFISKRFNVLTAAVAALDFMCLEASVLIGYWLWISFPWHGHHQLFSDYAQILWVLPPVGLFVFLLVGLYKPEMGVIGVEEQSLIFKAIWIIYLATFAFSFFYRHVYFSRLSIFYSVFAAISLLSAERFLVRRFFEWRHKRGIGLRRALIYGAGHQGQRLARWIRQSPKLGIQVEGFLDDQVETLVKKPVDPACVGGIEDLKKIARKKNINLLFIAHRKIGEEKVIEIFKRCQGFGIKCWIIPTLYRFHIERAELTNIGGIPLVGFRQGFGKGYYLPVKRMLDLLSAIVLLPAILVLGGLIAIGIYFNAKGPLFFKQIRIGQDGRPFMMYKFRTLHNVKSEQISPEISGKGQCPVTTPFRAFLRQTGLDELPQFFNVLRGDMSFIGPRPEMPFLVEKYGPLERERLSIKPGITGLWQISEDRKRLLIHENMDYDLYYVEHLSFNLDLAILVKTFTTVLERFTKKSAVEKK